MCTDDPVRGAWGKPGTPLPRLNDPMAKSTPNLAPFCHSFKVRYKQQRGVQFSRRFPASPQFLLADTAPPLCNRHRFSLLPAWLFRPSDYKKKKEIIDRLAYC